MDVEGNPPPADRHWTATWTGHLGGYWELQIKDPAGDVKLNEMTKVSNAYPRPGPGVLDSLGVEVLPDSMWVKKGTRDVVYSRPIKPWKRAQGAPPSSLAAS